MKDIHGISIDDGFKVRIWWRKGADTQEYYECDGRAVYNYDQMIVDLMYEEGCSEEEAIDWIEYNTIRSIGYWGPKAPVVIHSIEEI